MRAPLAAATTFSAPLVPASGEGDSPAAATRSRTISMKRGSEVYCAMPIPWVKGNDPRSRSWVRQPSIVVSSVTTRAFAPADSARPMRESTRPSSTDQYSWYHHGTSPMAFAVSSMGEQPWVEKM